MSITAEEIVRLFEEDPRARRRLAELLVSEPDVRLAIVSAALREVATRQDIAELREGLRRLEGRLARVEGRLDVLLKTFLAFSVPTLVAVIGVLLKMLLAP